MINGAVKCADNIVVSSLTLGVRGAELPTSNSSIKGRIVEKQAGAELCRTQVKLCLVKFGKVFHLPKMWRSSSICIKNLGGLAFALKVEVIFNCLKN